MRCRFVRISQPLRPIAKAVPDARSTPVTDPSAGERGVALTHYRWVICALLFFATTINYVDRQVFGLLGPTLTEEFHWTESDFSFIISAFTLAYAISYAVAGRMMDWIGERKGFVAGRGHLERGGHGARPGEPLVYARLAVAEGRVGGALFWAA